MKILITGTAGFIGFHLARKLIERGDKVTGLDSINNYYDQSLKYGRLNETGIKKNRIKYGRVVKSEKYSNYCFVQLKLEDKDGLNSLFENEEFDAVCNLAAQAGVRYSIINPHSYITSNIEGFLNVLEACKKYNVKNLSYASSSSVYGLNTEYPFSPHRGASHPVSLYAVSKKTNELMAHTYSHLYGIKTTGLRFFTVYGSWGRPDMALFLFTKAIVEGRPIEVFNDGNMERDFTYIDDIISGVIKVIDNPAVRNEEWDSNIADPASSSAPYRIFNIGKGAPVKLMDFIEAIEEVLGKKAKKNFLPIQPGDVPSTFADTKSLSTTFGYEPATSIKQGIANFIDWYREYYKI